MIWRLYDMTMSWIVSGMAVCRCTSFDSAMHLLFRISKPLLVVLILNKSLKYLVTNIMGSKILLNCIWVLVGYFWFCTIYFLDYCANSKEVSLNFKMRLFEVLATNIGKKMDISGASMATGLHSQHYINVCILQGTQMV